MGEAVAKEPSMEEILSSIRKIITDDGNSSNDDGDNDSHEHRESSPEITHASPAASIPTAQSPSEQIEQPQPTIISPEIMEQPISNVVAETAVIETMDEPEEEKFASDGSNAANVEAVPEVSQPAVVEIPAAPKSEPASTPAITPVQESSPRDEAATFKGALMSPGTDEIVSEAFERLKRETMESIEFKTESILRPMLSEWLDNNLPTLVERLVREEIERVSRGR